MTNFIIVGQGLAANVMAHTLFQHQLSFKVIGVPYLSNCSLVAAGIWNPIVFKRLTKSWLAHQTIPFLNTFYTQCQNTLNTKLLTARDIIKPFSEEQEKQLWIKKSKYELDDFLDETIYRERNDELINCDPGNAYGKVLQAGNIDIPAFLKATHSFFSEHFVSEVFDYSRLKIEADKVTYNAYEAENIIFCEGHLVKNNPWFNWVPLKPVKGEVLTISSNDLQLKKSILNRNGFIMNVSENTFKVGATYNWNDLNDVPSADGLNELEEKLKRLISCSYSINKHEAGVRPSSIDRRPVIGAHPLYKNMFVFNGLGTKGVMLAPFFANNFINSYLQQHSLNTDVDVKRFYHLLEDAK